MAQPPESDPPPEPAVYTALLAPPPRQPWVRPFEPPPANPLGEPLPLILLALAASAIIDKPPRPKQEPAHKREEANKKVLKVSAAYDVIDKVVTPREIAIAVLRWLPALWHIQSPNFPVWVDLDHSAAEMQTEIVERLRNKLKDGMYNAALQQENRRMIGKFLEHPVKETHVGHGEPNIWEQGSGAGHAKFKIRIGKLHEDEQI